jgi:hypothetical protein
MRREQPIPQPTEELIAKCDADNQFSNFDRLFRRVMSVPKSEVLKQEKKELHRNARARARKKKKSLVRRKCG